MKINPNTQYYKGHKYKIYPTEEQKQKLDRYIDLYRYVYNWALAKEQEIYELYKNGKSDKSFYTYFDLCTIFREYRNNEENQWLLYMPSHTACNAIKELCTAYLRFFNGLSGHPKYKTKKKSKKSFTTRSNRFRAYDTCIKIEGMNMQDRIDLGFNSGYDKDTIYLNTVISKDNIGNYFVSFCTIEDKIIEPHNQNIIGIDLGIRNTFTTSIPINGSYYHKQPLEKIRKLKRNISKLQVRISRNQHCRLNEAKRTKTKYEDIPKSKRQIKREKIINKKYIKIHNIKNTYYDTIIKNIVDTNPTAIVMEDFKYNKIINSQKYMAKYMVDTSFFSIIEKMKYQCNKRNISFIQAPTDFPSTQICNCCGYKQKMGNKKIYKCPICGNIIDRDLNAAYNLENYYYTENNSLMRICNII